MKYTQFFVAAATLLALPLLTTGCSTSFSPNYSGPLARSSSPLSGVAMGGQQPISGASIYLYAAGSGSNVNGYGAAATSLLTTGSSSASASPVLTDGNGNGYVLTTSSGGFNITGSFTCPAQNSQVYLVGQGGDAGSGPNSAISLILALGSCSNLANQSFISINELSTVAAVTALQQFIGSSVTNIGSSNGNLYGLQNAMLMAGNLVNLNYGGIVPSSTAVTNPTAKLFTLGDAMAACVNSTGPSSAGCIAFFAASPVTVTNTFAAMYEIATNPSYNPQAVINAVPATSAFGNALTTAPNDFSLAVSYHGGGLGSATANYVSATAVAIDGNGAAWVAACGVSCGNTQPDSIVQISPYTGTYANGYIMSGAGGFGIGSVHDTQALVIDQSNAVYSSNDPSPGAAAGAYSSFASITILGPSGVEFQSSPIKNSNFVQPEGIVIDQNGLAVVADAGNGSIYSVSASGTVNNSYITQSSSFAQLVAPTGIGIDTNGDIVVDDTGGNTTAIYATAGGNSYSQTETQAGAPQPTSLALTSGHKFWQLNPSTATIYKLNESGPAYTINGYTINTATGTTTFFTAAAPPPVGDADTLSGFATASSFLNGKIVSVASTVTTPGAYSFTVNSIFMQTMSTTSTDTGVATSRAVAEMDTATVAGAVSAQFLAVDGTSEVLVPACGAGCGGTSPDALAIFSDAGVAVPYKGNLQDPGLANPVGIAVDGSGNAWIPSGNTGSVTEFVGVASPVATPLAFALQNGQIGIKP